MVTLTLTPKELALLSQALGEAVAMAEMAVTQTVQDSKKDLGGAATYLSYQRIIKGQQAKHQALLHLMRKVDGGLV